jgi:RNA polymerase sigma factor (sigma-70 family)
MNKLETDSHLQFQKLIEQHQGILFKVVHAYCQDIEDRKDLLQEIMIQLWHSSHRYNTQFKSSTWVYRIALNVAISQYRKKTARNSKHIPLSTQPLPVQETDSTEQEQQLELLQKFIGELNELDKALMLLYLEEKSHAEISDILGISKSNVATKVGRIKEQLKQRFIQFNHI